MNLRLVLVFVLLLAFATGLTQGFESKQGSPAEVLIDFKGFDEVSIITVKTDPNYTRRRELLIDVHHREIDGLEQVMIRPISELGTYVYNYSFSEAGTWGLWMRYGTGIDLYDEYLRFSLSDIAQVYSLYGLFQGDLGADVPDFVQPLGFAVFGVLLLVSLILVVWTLNWLARHKARALNISP